MNDIPPPPLFGAMRFSATWRNYQTRVLAEMDGFMDDRRLHVVAAPGSGKTVLGLEAMRRLGRPVIALSPTLTIRNQWRERLCPLFLPDLEPWRERISTNLAQPGDMTIGTYQALHAAWKTNDAPFAALAALGPVTLVLDECHHLRREWWNALFALREALPDLTIVSLTATPPYDTSQAEWQRYEELCGPIDTEIGVPELVRNGDLAPHQDHVHFSLPSQDLVQSLKQRRETVYRLMDEAAANSSFHDQLLAHPFIAAPFEFEAEILEQPEALSAILVLLNHVGRKWPISVIELIGANPKYVPAFVHEWFEPLLELVLNRRIGEWELDPQIRANWLAQLGEAGLIRNKRVHFSETLELARLLSGSTAKLDSIVEILRAEHAALGDRLRMAVLTDHVRAAELPQKPGAKYNPQRLGVVPIFESLRCTEIERRLGVLSGTLVIIPSSACTAAKEACERIGLDVGQIRLRECLHDSDFCTVEIAGSSSNARVALVTQLVASGHVRVLVGTQALLGEGWDAPSINSLVLASNAGSFMLSNQMRGRAIRTNPDQPDKVSNIWHLATIDLSALAGEGPDMALMQRRFGMFDGVAEDGTPTIESGFDRLAIDLSQPAPDRNAATLANAKDRAETARHWQQSLGKGTARSRLREVAETRGSHISGGFHVRSTLQAAIVSAIGGALLSAGSAVRSMTELGTIVVVLGGATLAYSVPGLFKALRLFLRNGTLEQQLDQLGMVVLESLANAGHLSAAPDQYEVHVHPGLKGNHAVTIDGGTRADQHRFVESMLELLGPVQNPRYLLRRFGKVLTFEQEDFHGVPSLIGSKAEHAEFFLARWEAYIGTARMDFTRSANGRRMLLKARARSLSAGLRNPLERRSMWL